VVLDEEHGILPFVLGQPGSSMASPMNLVVQRWFAGLVKQKNADSHPLLPRICVSDVPSFGGYGTAGGYGHQIRHEAERRTVIDGSAAAWVVTGEGSVADRWGGGEGTVGW